MRICVFGAGSIGGLMAGLLADSGGSVSIIARGLHLQAIQARGLRVQTPDRDFVCRPVATDDPGTLGIQDLVIIATKTTALPEVAAAISPLLDDDTLVAFALNGVFWFYAHGMQNGANVARLDVDGALAAAIGPDRALGLIVRGSAEVTGPGVVVNSNGLHVLVGDATPGREDRARRVAEALSCPGLVADDTVDLRRAMWAKLARNVGSSPIACLTGADSWAIAAVPELRDIADGLMHETLAVAAAQGYPGISLQDGRTRSTKPTKPSMLQDLERGRPMEIETQLAIVQDLADQSGVPTPLLDTLLPLLKLRASVAGCYPALQYNGVDQ